VAPAVAATAAVPASRIADNKTPDAVHRAFCFGLARAQSATAEDVAWAPCD